MAKIIGAVTIDSERCKGCNLCVVACPTDVLALKEREVNNRGYHFAYMKNEDKCIGCQSCALVCPDACIEVFRCPPPAQPKGGERAVETERSGQGQALQREEHAVETSAEPSHVTLMKGNEALAVAAIRYGADGYFGYPITPQSEVLERLEQEMPWETTGMVVVQAESEVAAINMVYAGASCGKAVFTSTSSPGFSLMQEGMSYMAASEVPALVINVMRGGPGLGTIHPSQADYFQATKGGGHGDYHAIVLAPSSVQEMADFVALGWDLAFKYRCVSLILADGVIGQMMEKVVLPPQRPRRTDDEIRRQCPWAVTGRKDMRPKNVVTSLELDDDKMEANNLRFQATYRLIEQNETRCELVDTDDCDWLIVAFGSMARISMKAMELARARGIKVGMARPITLWPFPSEQIRKAADNAKGILVPELDAGQMIEDVKLAVECRLPVEHFGRLGGNVPTPDEILNALTQGFRLA